MRYIFRLQKENKAIKYQNIRKPFEHEDEGSYYKLIRVSNFWSNNYIEYESSGDRNKNNIN